MVKIIFKSSLLLFCLSSAIYALNIDKKNVYEYNYFAFGSETFSYSEFGVHKVFDSSFKSKAKITSSVYKSGALLNFADKFTISMDFISTLEAHDTTENWNFANGYSQTNKARIGTNSMKILYHYLMTNHSRVVVGGHYISNSFRRYGYKNAGVISNNQEIIYPQDKIDMSKIIMAEELSNTTIFDIGYWYESKKAGQSGFRYMGNIIYGLPIYQKTTNSTAPNENFSQTDGYNIDALIYGGYTIFEGFEIGVYCSYGFMKRDGGRVYLGVDNNNDGKEDTLLWPKNESKVYRMGIQTVWNF